MKKILSLVAALFLGAGLVLVGSAPAQAHDAVVTGVAECQEDGTYTVVWTVALSNYGDHQEIDLKVISHSPDSKINGVDGQVWLYEWAEHSANHGLPPFPENGVATYTQTGIPGSATQAKSTVQFDWKNGPSGDPEGNVTLPGDCEPTGEPPVEEPPTEEPPVDVCPNLEGDQAEIPPGMVVVDGSCITPPPPNLCEGDEPCRPCVIAGVKLSDGECPDVICIYQPDEGPLEVSEGDCPEVIRPELAETGVSPIIPAGIALGALVVGAVALRLRHS